MKISITSSLIRGERRYVLNVTPDGGARQRRYFDTRREAEAEAQQLRLQQEMSGSVWLNLTARQRGEIIAVFQEASGAGYSLRQVWDGFKTGQVNGHRQTRMLGDAIDELIAEMQANNNREGYIESLSYLRQFARGREQTPVHQFTTAEIERWFATRREAPQTKASNLGRLSSLFEMCWRKRYIAENPCKRIVRPRIEKSAPKILSPYLYARLLIGTYRKYPRMLAWVVCGLIGGLRPEETMFKRKAQRIKKIGWKDIDLNAGRIVVDSAATKIRSRRIVHLEPSAVEWLKLAKSIGAEQPIGVNTKKRYLKKMRKLIHAPRWPQDIMRHTAASVLMAKYQDAGKVADELGNSASVLLSTYRELMYREVSQKLLAITPNRLRPKRR